MAKKRPAARKKPPTTKTEKPAPREYVAMYGAGERPQHCRHCGATETRINTTNRFTNPERIIRYRVCSRCSAHFTTIQVIN